MSNLRIVWDNAADRAQIVASSEAGSLVATNLKSNLKSRVWRGQTVEESIVAQWPESEPVGCVVLAFNNFTSRATMQVKGYRRDELFPEFDTGAVECAPGAGLGQFQWGAPLGENFYDRGGASLYAYGYGGYGVVWIPGGRSVRKLEIHISDVNNPDTYLEVGRLIVGPWWSPMYNFDFGHSISFPDATQNRRTDAGDLRGERAARWKRLQLSLSNMKGEDRAAFLRLARRNGVSEPVFLSMFPECDDPLKEQAYQIYGKFEDSPELSQPRYDIYAGQLAVEEL